MSPQLAVLVLLLLTITPSASIQSSSFQYSLFASAGRLCQLQYLSLISYAASITSSLTFGRLFQHQPLKHIILAGGFLATASSVSGIALPGLCARAPIPSPAAPPVPPTPPPTPALPPMPPLPPRPSAPDAPPPPQPCDMDTAFAVAAASSGIGGLFGELGFLPKLVVATEVAARFADSSAGGGEGGGGGVGVGGGFGGAQAYAIMLTVIDMGDTISLQLTAPIVAALGITYSDFSNLTTLVGIGSASSTAVLLALGLAWFAGPWCGREAAAHGTLRRE